MMKYLQKIAQLSCQCQEEIGGYISNDNAVVVTNISTNKINSYIPRYPLPASQTFWHSHQKGGFSPTDIMSIWNTEYPWIVFDKSTRHFHHFSKNQPRQYLNRTWIRGLTDCYCLVRDWYKFELQIELPSPAIYLNLIKDDDYAGYQIERILRANFIPATEARPHDIIIWLDGTIKHLGVIINVDHQLQLLHHPKDQPSQLLCNLQEIQRCTIWRSRLPLPLTSADLWQQSLIANLNYQQIDLVRSSPSVTTSLMASQN